MWSNQRRGFLLGEYLLLALLLVGVFLTGLSLVHEWLSGRGGLTELALTGVGCFLVTLVVGDLRKQRRRG